MYFSIVHRICKVITLFFILLRMRSLNCQMLTGVPEKNGNTTDCEPEFETNVQQCLDGLYFYKWQTDVLNFHKNHNLFREILKRYFCRQYTNSLQCIHEMLATCRSDRTIKTVRTYLSQPWARKYNNYCDINQPNSSFLSKDNLTALQNNFQRQSYRMKSKLKNNVLPTTSNRIIENNTSRINRQGLPQQTIGVSHNSDDRLNNKETGSPHSPDQTGNTRDNVLNNSLFHTKSINSENSFRREQNDIEYHLLFQKLTSNKLQFLIQSAVLENQRISKPSDSEVEMLIEKKV